MTKIDFDGKLYSWEFLFNMAEKIECPIASPTTPLEDINKPNFQQQDKTKVAPKSKYEQILEAGQQQYKAAEELRQYDGGDIPDNPSGWNKNTKKSSGTIKIDRQRVLI